MTPPLLDPDDAAAIVHARLGRPAQDVLEAAVVLEAWGGVATVAALGLGGGILAARPGLAPPARRWTPEESNGPTGIVSEGIALLMAILAIAAWAGPLSAQLGATVLRHAVEVALPLTVCLQWTIRSRYLSRRMGLSCLSDDRLALWLAAVAVLALLLALPRFGAIAAMFVAIWVGGTVLARRGWGLAYGTLLIAGAVGLEAGRPADLLLGFLTATTLLGVVIAVRTAAGTPSLEPPGQLRRSLAAGAIGALLGGLLVGDTSLGWGIHGSFPALALVPSVIGSFWGGYHLWQFHERIPRGLLGVPLAHASGQVARGPATRIVGGALVRLLGATAALSGLVLAAGHWTRGSDRPSLFVAFAGGALVCLFVSLLESLGYLRWALTSAAVGLAAELAVNRWGEVPIAGAGLIAGSTLGTVLALAPLVGLLRSPGRVLATALWIK
jgi:hypothetical protein